ncbi:hypothetical protein KCP76_14555 [Salmonella enterica subsp. enterica serovar Weltevreden]|nr:hypothetical protein KCP76_14555 [Salmonella enterica subsp. enterica serovar Weltevreden]
MCAESARNRAAQRGVCVAVSSSMVKSLSLPKCCPAASKEEQIRPVMSPLLNPVLPLQAFCLMRAVSMYGAVFGGDASGGGDGSQ